jgi:exodeoxyribonuclease VII large subunit
MRGKTIFHRLGLRVAGTKRLNAPSNCARKPSISVIRAPPTAEIQVIFPPAVDQAPDRSEPPQVTVKDVQTDTPSQIYTVSRLTAEIKTLLEDRYPFIWVSGEVTNFTRAASGHFYFSLKDDKAQIKAVMFRGQSRGIKFLPENGMSLSGLGRISVYEPRGVYQIIFEFLEPQGVGALQVAFEQLKQRLAAEGLFESEHKKPLPAVPRCIALITSPAGAALQDLLQIMGRRFPNLRIEILPVRVQGPGAADEIAAALATANVRSIADVIIVARGGGSLEDLSAFNTEAVARAIFASQIPVVSAVGHETDFTIADFVADLRAPTPSAAAELVVPLKSELAAGCRSLTAALMKAMLRVISGHRLTLGQARRALIDPRKRLQDLRLRLDDQVGRLYRALTRDLQVRRERLFWRVKKLSAHSPNETIRGHKATIELKCSKIKNLIQKMIIIEKSRLEGATGKLSALGPPAVLARGYSITRSLPDGKVVRDSRRVDIGQALRVIVAKGSLTCKIEDRSDHGLPQF